MKIAIITPSYHPPVRGNAVTASRICRRLDKAGHEVRVYPLDALTAVEIRADVQAFRPDILHALHAFHGGRVARLISRETGIPYVVTLTGSDVYEALEDLRREGTEAVLRDAAAVVAFDQCISSRVTGLLALPAEKMAIIPQGVELPGDDFHCRDEETFYPGNTVIFLPAGLRGVKNVGFAIEPLAELASEMPTLRFVVAGPIVDKAYAAKVIARLDATTFACYVGEVGRHAIGWLYKRADVVLNTSVFEGGMPNSLLEALALGRPVLAADIEGNRSLVRDGETGLLYRDEAAFLAKARLLASDAALRERLGEAGKRFILTDFSPESEAAAYMELYERVISSAPQTP